MGRRSDQRVNSSLPVRVFGTDADGKPFVRLARTVNISASGARIGGIRVNLKPGDIIGVQHGPEKARFKVAWVGKMGTRNAGEIGLLSLEPRKQIWGFTVPAGGSDDYEPKPNCQERRSHARFDCDLGFEVRTGPDAPPMHVRCTDISRGGCYLETWSPFPVGTTLHLSAQLPAGPFRCVGEVRTVDPTFGMGILLARIESTEPLADFLSQMEASQARNAAVSESILKLDQQVGTEAEKVARQDPGNDRQRLVLLAEDSKFLRSAYSLYLRREGFRVITADDGVEAIERIAVDKPDVIVLDLLMPRLGGVGALKMLKETPRTAHIPVIVLSGLPSCNESKIVACGAFAYLAKTQIGPEELPEYVKSALNSTHPLNPDGLVPRSSDSKFSAGY
jgi:CheY-like chemotaxis protein